MNEMQSIHQIIVAKGAEYEVQEIDSEHLIGVVAGSPYVIRAILDRTAVIHPFDDDSPTARKLSRLDQTFVWPRDIKWKDRPLVAS